MNATTSRRAFLHAAAAGLAALPALRAAAAEQRDEQQPEYQLGCFTRPWNRWHYRTALDGIAQAGFKYAGLMRTPQGHLVRPDTDDETIATLKKDLADRDLRLLCIYSPTIAAEDSVARGLAELKRLLDHCSTLECPYLLFSSAGRADAFDAWRQAVREACPYAAEKKVTITLKPHGGRNGTGPQLKQIVEAVNHENFRIVYDPGNILHYNKGEVDPLADAPIIAPYVAGLCAKDYLPPPEGVNVTPGQGQVDFEKLLAILRKAGFRSGPILLETTAPAETPNQATVQATQAQKYLTQLIPKSQFLIFLCKSVKSVSKTPVFSFSVFQ